MQNNPTPGLLIKDRYKLKQSIGQGSFGEVWLAEDLEDNKHVAIKMYQWLDRDGMEAFYKEMETTKDLVHPNLLLPSEFDEWNQRPFLVMEYCGKGSVSRLAGNLNEDMAWRFIRDVASGLAYLHGLYEPVVHQDVKPYNIVISDDDSYKITDFGISTKVRDQLARHSANRNPNAGALAYMAPERFTPDSSAITASDIWALGVTIYELLSGRLPFNGMGGGMLVGGAEIPHVPQQFSGRLDRLVTACLQKETWNRPTAADIESYAEAVLRGESPVGVWETASDVAAAPAVDRGVKEMAELGSVNKSGRRPKVTAAAIAGIVVVCGLFLAGLRAIGSEDEEVTEDIENTINDNDLVIEDNIQPAGDEAEAEEAVAGMNQADNDVPQVSEQPQAASPAPAPKVATPAPKVATPTAKASGRENQAVAPDGYRGPEDTGRPQNQVNRSDYRGQDRNGYVSRDASANPASRSYTSDSRYKKRGDALPQGHAKSVSGATEGGKAGDAMNNELRLAISYGDYTTLKHFADGGEVSAYVPMAKLCLRRNEYAEAEKYAKKAKAAGVARADEVFALLRQMGYYD